MPASIDYGIRPPKFRLPEATRLGGVTLQVSDLARSTDYYTHVLGLRVIEQSAMHALLGARESVEPLVRLQERRGARAVPRRGLLGLFHFAILLPDRPSLGRLLQHLADQGEQPGMSDHLVSEAIYLQDPDNLGIEVYADRPRSSWKQAMGQLEMATIPLDVRDVLESGGGEHWKGMPAGTTMGHVHLHVGDIERASAFYHEGLGLDKVVWTYPGALFLSAGGYHHHLGTNTWARGAPSASEADAKLVEWQIIVPTPDDVERAAESLETGFSVRRQGAELVTADPWGTQLRVRPA